MANAGDGTRQDERPAKRTKRLPSNAQLDHLKQQARDLLAGCGAGEPAACQRVRTFHPRFASEAGSAIAGAHLTWSDAQFVIAREYDFASWARLKAHVGPDKPGPAEPPLRDRIEDPILRNAVTAVDDGDVEALRRLLTAHPDLATRRTLFESESYFRTPSLLAFVAENPVRNDCLPPNVTEIAALILDYGPSLADVEETLTLVASGRVAREAGLQSDLIALLVTSGAEPRQALQAALAHGEIAAADVLLRLGAPVTLPVAAALGDLPGAARLLAGSDAADRHLALAFAAQHGHASVLRLLLDAGENPNRYNPQGAHAHSTPLHQAALQGHDDAVRALLAHGARPDLHDKVWNGTAMDWARHTGRASVLALLAEHRD